MGETGETQHTGGTAQETQKTQATGETGETMETKETVETQRTGETIDFNLKSTLENSLKQYVWGKECGYGVTQMPLAESLCQRGN